MATYGASKAALKFFNDSLRVEQKKYNVDVVNFIPGSFVMQSNIAANQQMHSMEQKKSMTQEQLQFYGTYFDKYNRYLKVLSKSDRSVEIMQDPTIVNVFEQALLEVAPKALYKCEPWRFVHERLPFFFLYIFFCLSPDTNFIIPFATFVQQL